MKHDQYRELRRAAMLSVQGALIGEVTDNLVAVTLGVDDKVIRLRAYFEGEITEDEWEIIWRVAAEMSADFAPEILIDEKCLSLDDHELEILDVWVFLRKRKQGEP